MMEIYISMYTMYKQFATAMRRRCEHCTYRGSKSFTVARVWVDNFDLDGYNDIHHSQTLCIILHETTMECHFRRQYVIRLHQSICALETCL